jgi:Flp pilus assembly pilin Flp
MPRRRADTGATSVEYALLAVFLLVVVAIAMTFLGHGIDHLFQLGRDAVPGAGN